MSTLFSDRKHPRVLCLFDVDDTLTLPRQKVTESMLTLLEQLRKTCVIGIVGGSDISKIREQLQVSTKINLQDQFDYVFAENGLVAYQFGNPLSCQSFLSWLGEEKYKNLVKFCLGYISQLDIPVMRGTFIEFRNGMINVSPIGRNASIAERNAFEEYDKKHEIRAKFVKTLKEKFNDYGLTFSIGGKISFDVFPQGWDKTYALRHVVIDEGKVQGSTCSKDLGWDEIHFFGDKTYQGGNDHEIFSDSRTIGHTVIGPEDTEQQLKQLFFQ